MVLRLEAVRDLVLDLVLYRWLRSLALLLEACSYHRKEQT